MQETTELYKQLLADPNHYTETRLAIGERGSLIDKNQNYITFGGFRILIDFGGADSGFGHNVLHSVETIARVFSEDTLKIGGCPSAEIDITMEKPIGYIPRMARLVPYVRLTDGIRHSEWIQKGVYWLDTRQEPKGYGDTSILKLHGYDTMMKAEIDFPTNKIKYPAKDIDVVNCIANEIGTTLDERTVQNMNRGYLIEMPMGYSAREVLSYIAASYCGCFVMNDIGQLRLIRLKELPTDTNYLCTSDALRYTITFGGDRILV